MDMAIGLVLVALVGAAQAVIVVVLNARYAKELRRDVQAATQAARDAFTEANHVNRKISDLNERLLEKRVTDAN